MKNFDNLHCDNKDLIQELEKKEELFSRIAERIMRCPNCSKGHFIFDNDGSEYSSDFLVCDTCDYFPNSNREKLIYDIVSYGDDCYWDYLIYEYISNFEYDNPRTYDNNEQKVREFNAEEWDREEHHCIEDYDKIVTSKWKDIVEPTIREHIEALDTAIERAKKVKMLKHLFKEDNNDR